MVVFRKKSLVELFFLTVFTVGCGDSSRQAAPTAPTTVEESPAAQAPVDVPKVPVEGMAVATNSPGLQLAQRSGCLVCHSVDKKIIGPAWRDVAARYRNDPAAEARLIAKVVEGGKGNWTEVTGGVAMPPYGTRVASDDIARLVQFVLALK